MKTADFGQKTVDFLVSEFKTNTLFVSFQSRERIQMVRMFFFFFPTSTRYERLLTEDGNPSS